MRPIPLSLAVALVIAGCAGEAGPGQSPSSEAARAADPTPGPNLEMPPAPPPTYQPGDTYTYSRNGQSEIREVLSVRGDQVRWRSGGVEWVEQTAVVTPPLAWTSDPTVGKGQQEIIGDPYSLFPLRVGKTTTFEAHGKSEKVPGGWTRQYGCAVEGSDTVTVPAGSFETFRIECRQGDQRQTIHYSPRAENIVLGVAESPSRTDRFELRSYTRAAGETATAQRPAAPTPAATATPAPAPIPATAGTAGVPRDIMPDAPRPMPTRAAGETTAAASPAPAPTPVTTAAGTAADSPAPVPVAVPRPAPRADRRLPPVPPDARPSPHYEGTQVKPVIGPDGKPVIAPDGAPVMLTLDDRGVPITEVAAARRAGPLPVATGGTRPATAQAAAQAATSAAAAHLASYRSETNAERGWQVLERRFPTALAGLRPAYRTVDLPGKGRFIRLFATGLSGDTAAGQLCASVHAGGAYCRVMSLGG